MAERHDGIVDALRRFGVGRAIARMLADVGVDLRGRTARSGAQSAAMIDLGSGSRVGEIVSGVTNRIDIRGHLVAMQAGHRYAHLHTHPSSTAFSDQDGATFVAHRGLRLFIVIGLDGTWYLLGKRRGAVRTPVDVLRAFRDEVAVLRPRYQPLVQSGATTPEDAWRRMTHEIWQRIAAQLGLRYDRVDMSGFEAQG